jgi:hypothetical protein
MCAGCSSLVSTSRPLPTAKRHWPRSKSVCPTSS